MMQVAEQIIEGVNIGGFRPRVLRDPVHGFIEITDPLIMDLIDCPEFQRLGRISQLGTSFVTYRGATHTRFAHSIGTMHIFMRLTEGLLKNKQISENEIRLGAIASLLHDIGHGPYSHALEKTFSKANHEEWTRKIITDPQSNIYRRLHKEHPTLPSIIADILSSRPGEGTYPKVSSLIHGQLDADRMDYLLRDSLATGTTYGKYDLDRLCHTFIGFHNNFPLFSYKGLMALEEYVLARYYMYWQVYYHKTTRVYERMLQNALKRAVHLFCEGNTEVLPFNLAKVASNELRIQDFAAIDDSDIIFSLKLWANHRDPILKDFASRLLDRRLFKWVASDLEFDPVSFSRIIKSNKAATIIAKYDIDPDYYQIIDSPSQTSYPDLYGEQKEPVYVLSKSEVVKNLPDYSDVIKSLEGKKRTVTSVYIPCELEGMFQEVHNLFNDSGGTTK